MTLDDKFVFLLIGEGRGKTYLPFDFHKLPHHALVFDF